MPEEAQRARIARARPSRERSAAARPADRREAPDGGGESDDRGGRTAIPSGRLLQDGRGRCQARGPVQWRGMAGPALDLQHVGKTYREGDSVRAVLADVCVSIAPGE